MNAHAQALANTDKETRVALVIGNSGYPNAPLENPANDAADLAASLEKLGFNVLVRENVGERGLKEAVDVFAKHLKKGGIGLFFFAGHGVQLKDQNFLLPVDVGFESEADVSFKSVSAEYVLSRMAEAGNRINIVILDACRNNPLQQSRKTITKGLGVMNVGRAEKGTFIAYATSPGSTAADGKGRNGLYTKHLLRSLETQDSDIDKVFGRVRTGVVQDTSGEQVPWTSSSVVGNFYFNVKEDQAALRNPVTTTTQMATHEAVTAAPLAAYDPAQEQALWEQIKDSRNVADYVAYLEKFSGARRAAYARWMVQKLGGTVPATARPAGQAVAAPIQLSLAAPSTPQAVPPMPNVAAGDVPSPGTVIKDCADCPELLAVPAGEFVMGSSPKERMRELDEEPAHRVRVPAPFAVGKFEITRAQYAAFAKETNREAKPGCHSTRGGFFHKNPKATWQDPGYDQKSEEPVVCISWEDARAYTSWLSRKTGKQYRLLNEAEWEYAARAGTTSRRFWDDSDEKAACKFASVADASYKAVSPGAPLFRCSDGIAHTAPVGKFPPNAFGLHDMLGNVWEWVEDCWNEGYAGAPDVAVSRVTGSCNERVFRGGSWNSSPVTVRSAYRDRDSKDERHDNLGFRVARALP